MQSENKLYQYSLLPKKEITSFQSECNSMLLNNLVEMAKEKPLEFSCTMAGAFKELEMDFQKRREELHDAIGEVVIEMVKQGYASPKKV